MIEDKNLIDNLKNRVRLIVMDIDGTLLRSDHTLSERTALALRKVQQAGYKITLASGKLYRSYKQMLDRIGLDGYHISSGGSVVTNSQTGERQIIASFGRELLIEALKFLEDFPDFPVAWYLDDALLAEKNRPAFKALPLYHEPDPQLVARFYDCMDALPAKLLIEGDDSSLNFLKKNADAVFDGRLQVLRTSPDFVELVPFDVNKGHAIQWIAQKYCITSDEILAIGDGENDIPMFQIAGYKVAMGNAMPSLKQFADEITLSSDEDGIAVFLEGYFSGDK